MYIAAGRVVQPLSCKSCLGETSGDGQQLGSRHQWQLDSAAHCCNAPVGSVVELRATGICMVGHMIDEDVLPAWTGCGSSSVMLPTRLFPAK